MIYVRMRRVESEHNRIYHANCWHFNIYEQGNFVLS